MKSPIEQEIEWCMAHMGESANGVDFEKGFIAGLKQALRFEKPVKNIDLIDSPQTYENWLRSEFKAMGFELAIHELKRDGKNQKELQLLLTDENSLYFGGKIFYCDCFEDEAMLVKVDGHHIFILINDQEIIINPLSAREFAGYVAEATHNSNTK